MNKSLYSAVCFTSGNHLILLTVSLAANLQFHRVAREPNNWLKMCFWKRFKEFHITFHRILEIQHQPTGSKAAHHPSLARVSLCTVAKLSSLGLPDSERALCQGWQTAGRQTCFHLEHHRLQGTATARSCHSHPPVSLKITGFCRCYHGQTATPETWKTGHNYRICLSCIIHNSVVKGDHI